MNRKILVEKAKEEVFDLMYKGIKKDTAVKKLVNKYGLSKKETENLQNFSEAAYQLLKIINK